MIGSSEMDNFQQEVGIWVESAFGASSRYDVAIRTKQFLEEALELAQALKVSRENVHKMVDFVYDRPVGVVPQEAGGVMVSFAALCEALNILMGEAGEEELDRIWINIGTIIEKQKNKTEV